MIFLQCPPQHFFAFHHSSPLSTFMRLYCCCCWFWDTLNLTRQIWVTMELELAGSTWKAFWCVHKWGFWNWSGMSSWLWGLYSVRRCYTAPGLLVAYLLCKLLWRLLVYKWSTLMKNLLQYIVWKWRSVVNLTLIFGW